MKIGIIAVAFVLILTGCEGTQQDRLAERANRLLDPQAYCVTEFMKFIQGPYMARFEIMAVDMKTGNDSKNVAAVQSLQSLLNSFDTDGCPIELKVELNESRQALEEVHRWFVERRDRGFVPNGEERMDAAATRFERSFNRMGVFVDSFDTTGLIDLEKLR